MSLGLLSASMARQGALAEYQETGNSSGNWKFFGRLALFVRLLQERAGWYAATAADQLQSKPWIAVMASLRIARTGAELGKETGAAKLTWHLEGCVLVGACGGLIISAGCASRLIR